MSVIWIDSGRFGVLNLWTPSQISTMLWLDASDSSTVTTVSGAVSQWSDKSGNARHATETTNRPVYTTAAQNGLNVVEFNPDNTTFQRLTFTRLTSIRHIFFVAKKNNLNDSNCVLTDAGAAGSSIDLRGVFLGTDTGSNFVVQQLSGSLSTATRNAWHIAEIRADGTNASLGIDGTRTTSADTDLMQSSIIGWYNQALYQAQYSFRGQIGEFIFSASALSDATRQIVEGYLAYKWGLQGNLPAGHPYKTTPPTI